MHTKAHIATCLMAAFLASCGKEAEKAKSASAPTTAPKACKGALALQTVQPTTYAELFARSFDDGTFTGDVENGYLISTLGTGDSAVSPLLGGAKVSTEAPPANTYQLLTLNHAPRTVTVKLKGLLAKQLDPQSNVAAAEITVASNVVTDIDKPTSITGEAESAVAAFRALFAKNKAAIDAAYASESSALAQGAAAQEYVVYTIQVPDAGAAPLYQMLYVHAAGARRSGPRLATSDGDAAGAGLALGAVAPPKPAAQGAGVEFAATFRGSAVGHTKVVAEPERVYKVRALPRLGIAGSNDVDPIDYLQPEDPDEPTTTAAPGTTLPPGAPAGSGSSSGTKPASGSTATGGCE